MLISEWDEATGGRFICPVCGKKHSGLGIGIGVCPECIQNRWEDCRGPIDALHAGSRQIFQLPLTPPRNPEGLRCSLCLHRCRMGLAEQGYCGVRTGSRASMRQDGRSRAHLSFYYDPLPTNCVADWVCPGGTGAGYPRYSHDKGTEVGFYNLAVFFEACNLNCIYCQNWYFKSTQNSRSTQPSWHSLDALDEAVNKQTSCICYFGGDPTPQLPYALRVSERVRTAHPDQILRICWETNGSMHPAYLKRMARLSLESGGCIKFDLKAWSPNLHKTLCGCDNHLILENFKTIATQWAPLRPDPPLLVASTVLVPGYVGEEEVFNIASFIAGFDPDIPYALLAFAPHFCLEDFPTTSRSQAEACVHAAQKAGLCRVRLGNRHLIQ